MARKQHNRGVDIPPALVERMLASGKSAGQVAAHFNVDRGTLYYRRDTDPEMRAAFDNGLSRVVVTRKAPPQLLSEDTGSQLECLLEEIYLDLKEMAHHVS